MTRKDYLCMDMIVIASAETLVDLLKEGEALWRTPQKVLIILRHQSESDVDNVETLLLDPALRLEINHSQIKIMNIISITNILNTYTVENINVFKVLYERCRVGI